MDLLFSIVFGLSVKFSFFEKYTSNYLHHTILYKRYMKVTCLSQPIFFNLHFLPFVALTTSTGKYNAEIDQKEYFYACQVTW